MDQAERPGRSELRNRRRSALLDAMAEHLLQHGLAGSPLRALARAAGTSDRMLLYYFPDKDALLGDLLQHVAERLEGMLGAASGPASYAELLWRLWSAARTPAVQPYMQLFIELASAAARGEEPHRAAAGRIADSFARWTAERLEGPESERRAQAWLLLATLDGLFLLHGAGRAEAAAQAAVLATSGRSDVGDVTPP